MSSVYSNEFLVTVSPEEIGQVEVVVEQGELTLEITQDAPTVISIEDSGMQGTPGNPGLDGQDGAVGPQGPQGQPGVSSSQAIVFQFPQAQQVWSCTHNIGRLLVDVVTVDINDDEMIGDIEFISPVLTEIHWYYPAAGSACIST